VTLVSHILPWPEDKKNSKKREGGTYTKKPVQKKGDGISHAKYEEKMTVESDREQISWLELCGASARSRGKQT